MQDEGITEKHFTISPLQNLILIFKTLYLGSERAFSTQLLLCLVYVLDRIYLRTPFYIFHSLWHAKSMQRDSGMPN